MFVLFVCLGIGKGAALFHKVIGRLQEEKYENVPSKGLPKRYDIHFFSDLKPTHKWTTHFLEFRVW
jgi:hypothetical protein